MRRIFALLLGIVLLSASACNRYISPYEAANGKAKCGRSIR